MFVVLLRTSYRSFAGHCQRRLSERKSDLARGEALAGRPQRSPLHMSEEGKLAGPPLRREGNLAGCAQRSPLHMSEEGKAGSDRRRGERASCGFAIMGLASCCCSRVEGTARLRFCCGRLSFCSSHLTQSRSLRCLFLCLETCISLPFPLIPLQP
jgi:hypothetical protein